MKLPLTLVVAAWVLAGCASEPNVYYTLTKQGPVTASASQMSPNALSPDAFAPGLYTLTSVVVPPPVDDSMLVVRRSDDVLMKLAHDRWTAPLGQQFSNALSVALTRELGMPPLSRAQTAAQDKPPGSVTRMAVDVQQFDLVPGQYAALTALWQITPNQGNEVSARTCYTSLSQSVQPGVAPLVKAQQANISELAQAIAVTWRTGTPPTTTRCQ